MKFRKKPVVIEAVRWTGANFDALYAWGGGDTSTPEGIIAAKIVGHGGGEGEDGKLSIETLEGDMLASIGDWIIRGVKGEFYPCKDEIFRATYDCLRCNGSGRVSVPCPDPQCGDSTWDHECGLGAEDCPACSQGNG